MLSTNWNERAATLISKVKTEHPDVVFESVPTLEEAVRGKTCTKEMVATLQKELKEVEIEARKLKVERARALVAEIHADPRYELGKANTLGGIKKLDGSLEAATKKLAQLTFDADGKYNGIKPLTAAQADINIESIRNQWENIISKIAGGPATGPAAVEIVVDVEALESAYALHCEIKRYTPPPKGQFPAFDKPYHTYFAKAFDGLVFESETGKYVSGKFTKKLQEGLRVVDSLREPWARVLQISKESFLKNFEKLKTQWKDTIEQDEGCRGWVAQLQDLYPLVEGGDMDALASVSDLMTRIQDKHVAKSAPPPPKEDWKKVLREVNTMEKTLEKKIGARKFDDVYKYKYGGPLEEAYNDFVDMKKPRCEETFLKQLEATQKYLIAQLNAPAKKSAEKFEDDFDDDEEDMEEEEDDEEEDQEDDYESSFVAEDSNSSIHKRKTRNGEKRPRGGGGSDVDWEDLADLGTLAVESTWKRFKDQKHKSIDVLRRLVKDQEKKYRVSFTNKAGEEIFAEDREALNGGLIAKWASDIIQQYRKSTQDETNEITFRIVEEEENKQNI